MYAKSCCYSFHYQCDAFFLYASCGGIIQLFAAIEHIRYRQMVAFGMPFQFQACIFDGGSRQDGDSNQGVFLDVSPCYECQSFALMVSKEIFQRCFCRYHSYKSFFSKQINFRFFQYPVSGQVIPLFIHCLCVQLVLYTGVHLFPYT